MNKLLRLMREAHGTAKWRGHEMRAFDTLDNHTARSECKVCGRTVTVNSKPLPNEIDIAGEAVALTCRED